MRRRGRDLLQKGNVRSTIRMRIPLSKQDEALEILESVHSRVQYEPGCISSRLYGSLNEERVILVEELWASLEDIRLHLRSDAFRRVLLVIEMAEERPEIRFDTIAHSTGVETVENARNSLAS